MTPRTIRRGMALDSENTANRCPILDALRLIDHFAALETRVDEVKPMIKKKVKEYRNVLEEQCDLIFRNLSVSVCPRSQSQANHQLEDPEDYMKREAVENFRSRDYWIVENAQYAQANFRLRKCARVINELAANRECTLLDA